MNHGTIAGITVTPLPVLATDGGSVLHALRSSEQPNFVFGEAYLSEIEENQIRAWKRHREMTLNLVVPTGAVRFVIFDDRNDSPTRDSYQEVLLSRLHNYSRLTVAPMLWVGFQGLANPSSTLLNIADMEHDPAETDRAKIDRFTYHWHQQ